MINYVNKDGELKVYNQKGYNKTHYLKHKENQHKHICNVCNKEMNRRNKSNHEKTEKHKLHMRLNQNEELRINFE